MSSKVTVRYGAMGLVGMFSTEFDNLRRGDRVVVKSDRGSEAGEVVNDGLSADEAGQPDGEILRILTPEDEKELSRISGKAVPAELAFCRDRIRALSLPMKLVDAEHLLGGEKIIFYFIADGRVDFRQLVKDIAREYRTRIELRQIGVRDEARLLAELGHCGQRLCCKSFMKSLEPVTMRMAKSQKATLDPTKISGVCGRLMCCLRYEDRIYSDLKGKLPKRGANVVTRKASGKVVDADILAQMIAVKTANSNIVRVHVSDIVSVEGGGRSREEDAEEDAGAASCACNPSGEKPCPAAGCPQSQERPREQSPGEGQGQPAQPRRSSRRRSGRRGRGGGNGGNGGSGASPGSGGQGGSGGR